MLDMGVEVNREEIGTVTLVVKLAEKSRLYKAFTFDYPKAWLHYINAVYINVLLIILVTAKNKYLTLWLVSECLSCIM